MISAQERLDILQVTEACGAGVRRHLELILPALQERGWRCGLMAFSGRNDVEFDTLLERLQDSGCPVEFLQLPDGLSLSALWRARFLFLDHMRFS